MLREGQRLFGTDGVRGVANTELSPDFALRLGRAAGSLLDGGPVLVGRDTRRSGEMLSLAIQAGFHSAGIDTIDVGILPSGGISHLTYATEAQMGVVVSASHNPAPDNGIKFLSKLGDKLSDAEEDVIEARLRDLSGAAVPFGAAVGTRFTKSDAAGVYVRHLADGSSYTFRGLAVTLDCANGAAYQAAPALFRALGADVEVIGTTPDGMNINDGVGATHPEAVQAAAAGRVGLAFDGDADRLIATAEDGRIVDGDVIMAVLALHWRRAGILKNDTLVATVMSNLGLRRSMAEAGITLVQAKVGDRYVLEEMRSRKAVLGGEQSGHVICLDRGRTGDGLLTAIRLLEVMAGTGRTLAELAAAAMTVYPQVLLNVRVQSKDGLDAAAELWDDVADVEQALGEDGRVLVRPSGTEPLIRVMVEAADQEAAQRYAQRLATTVESVFGTTR